MIKKDVQKNENEKESIQVKIKNMSDQVEAWENDLIETKLESESINVALTNIKTQIDEIQSEIEVTILVVYRLSYILSVKNEPAS